MGGQDDIKMQDMGLCLPSLPLIMLSVEQGKRQLHARGMTRMPS
jgi:hypothetical protein